MCCTQTLDGHADEWKIYLSQGDFFSAGNAFTLVICECHRNDEGPHTQTQKLSESGKMAGGMGRERRRDRREEEEF